LRRIFEPERSETAEGLTIFYLQPNTNWEIKSRRTRRGEGHTASLAKMRKAQILIGKPERRHDFGDLRANGRTKIVF
jgi:hypothetical protein